ncbi:UNVERIFIED_CONTAM: hypothetical protein B566_EDAN019388 [Ephemera danica]|nr:hypothetical protein B566_EDAN019388 [Ephemera danica]
MDNRANCWANTCLKFRVLRPEPCYDKSSKFLPYQLSMVVYWTTMAVTGNGELGFDSGEGA